MLCWNCRGAARKTFMKIFKEMVFLYKLDILAVLEIRISGNATEVVYKRIGAMKWIRAEADGFYKGIWVLWDKDQVDLRIVEVHKHFVHMLISPGTVDEWQLSIMYMSPRSYERSELWIGVGIHVFSSP